MNVTPSPHGRRQPAAGARSHQNLNTGDDDTASDSQPLLPHGPALPSSRMHHPSNSAVDPAAAASPCLAQRSPKRFLLCNIIFRLRPLPASPVLMATVFVLAVSIVNEVIVYQSGSLSSQFYSALIAKDKPQFLYLLLKALGILTVAALGKTAVVFLTQYLALSIRTATTTALHQFYCASFPKLLASQSPPDMLDQRIAQDIDRLSTLLAEFIESVILSPALIAYYTYNLTTLSGWSGPAIIYLYFVIGAFASSRLVDRVARSVAAKDKAEGSFRALHAHVATHREPITLSGPLPRSQEQHRLDASWSAVRVATLDMMRQHAYLRLVTELVSYLGSIMNYIAIAIAIFAGAYDHLDSPALSGLVAQNGFVAIYLVYKLTSLVSLTDKVSDILGHLTRVSQVLNVAWEEEHEAEQELLAVLPSGSGSGEGGALISSNLCLATPSGEVLFQDLSFSVGSADWLHLNGPNGVGKTSLFRAICGIWPIQRGQLQLPANAHVLFLAQRPYLVQGSLTDQLIVCSPVESFTLNYSEAHTLLHEFKLGHLLKSDLDMEPDHTSSDTPWTTCKDLTYWTARLSPGEQQRLAAVRLLLHVRHLRRLGTRVWVLVDEGVSAMDVHTEAHFWNMLKHEDVAVIAVSHHYRADKGVFNRVVELKPAVERVGYRVHEEIGL